MLGAAPMDTSLSTGVTGQPAGQGRLQGRLNWEPMGVKSTLDEKIDPVRVLALE